MHDQFSIITTLVTGFGLALVFGWLAERFLKTPALVGFIIAGVAVGLFPLLPAVDAGVTQQFAEIGVILLMFGVGLHFSVADLVKVKGVAVTGALIQMTTSAAAGTAVALLAWSWSLPLAIVFGLTLSCASTVVVMKALELRRLTSAPSGQVAIGWLVVQDLVTVFIMVCLPIVAQVTQGDGPVDPRLIAVSLGKTMLGLFIFVAGMLVVGRRVFPWMLQRVALVGSRELFTLCVLAIAIGIAYGAGAIFKVSFALGAFFAGMVMRESSFAHRAAKNCLPLQDAFAVLFFVSVGLMLDLNVFVEEPLAVVGVVLIILLITSSVSALLVLLLGWPLDTALVLGACVSQLGEFSFILCGQGITLGIASERTMSLIVAASILTIAVNPVMFALIPRVRHYLVSHSKYFRRTAMRDSPLASKVAQPKTLKGHVVMAEMSEVMQALLPKLDAAGIASVGFVTSEENAPDMSAYKHGSVVVGDPSDPVWLVKVHVMSASVVVLPSPDIHVNKRILEAVRSLKSDLPVILRVVHQDAVRELKIDEHTTVVCDVTMAASMMADMIHGVCGLTPAAEQGEEDDDGDDELTADERAEGEKPEQGPDWTQSIRERLRTVHMPEIKVPSVKMPDVKLPKVSMPKVKMPAFHLPRIRLPEVTIKFKRPDTPEAGPASPVAPTGQPDTPSAPSAEESKSESAKA